MKVKHAPKNYPVWHVFSTMQLKKYSFSEYLKE